MTKHRKSLRCYNTYQNVAYFSTHSLKNVTPRYFYCLNITKFLFLSHIG